MEMQIVVCLNMTKSASGNTPPDSHLQVTAEHIVLLWKGQHIVTMRRHIARAWTQLHNATNHYEHKCFRKTKINKEHATSLEVLESENILWNKTDYTGPLDCSCEEKKDAKYDSANGIISFAFRLKINVLPFLKVRLVVLLLKRDPVSHPSAMNCMLRWERI